MKKERHNIALLSFFFFNMKVFFKKKASLQIFSIVYCLSSLYTSVYPNPPPPHPTPPHPRILNYLQLLGV